MAIDPDDLLIFKNRVKNEATPEKMPELKQEVGNNQETGQARNQDKDADTEVEQEVATTQVEESTQEHVNVVQNRKENIEQIPRLSKKADLHGVSCVIHPWRQAYAICDYCKRPFCYADIIDFHGNSYCLNDIDQATSIRIKHMETPTFFAYISSLLFALSSVILIYIMYNPAGFLIADIESVGFSVAILGVLLQYIFIVVELLITLMSLVSAVVVIKRSNRAFVFGVSVLVLTLLDIGYEYLNSNAPYLYFVLGVTLVNIAVISTGRLNIIGSTKIERTENATEHIEWPRPEVF